VTADAAAGQQENGAGRLQVREWVAAILGNATVITGLLVYFGWRRNDAHATGLGIQENILDQSTQDYVLRSVGPVIVILLVTLAVAFVAVAVDRAVTPWLARPRTGRSRGARFRRWMVRLLPGTGFAVPVIAVVAYLAVPALAVLVPLATAVGALLVAYAGRVRRAPGNHSGDATLRAVTRVLVGGLVVVCLFWATDIYAAAEGRRLADQLPGEIPQLTQVTIYSAEQLHLDGALESPLAGDNSAYRFRYTGLRLLTRTGDRYFLISDCWTKEHGTIVMLITTDAQRLEFVRDVRPGRPRPVCPLSG
jgi:hypothetical protein